MDYPLRKGLYGTEYRDEDKRVVEERPEERNIKRLWQRNHEIINLAAKGFKHVEIAEILGIHPATVTNTLNSDLGAAKLSDLRRQNDEETKKDVEKIRVLTKKALEVYHEVFENESGEATLKDRLRVADTVVLELSGMRVPTKVHSVNTVLSPDDLEAFKRRGAQAAQEAGLTIDTTAEEVSELEPEAAGN